MKSNHSYFPVDAALEAWGLFATCAGRVKSEPGAEFPSREHPDEYYFTWERGRVLSEWQLAIVEDGSGEAEFENGRHAVLTRGSLIAIAPGAWHRYRPDKATGWTTKWLGFGGPVASRLMAAAGFGDDCVVQSSKRMRHLRNVFSSTVDAVLECGQARPFAASASIFAFLAELAEASQGAGGGADAKSRHKELIRNAKVYIVEHSGEVIDFKELAERLGVNYRTFRHIFAKESGMPPLRFQMETKLSRAKSLLVSSDLPVSEIAALLGFNSPWYFAHFFQRETGCTAIKYRAGRGKLRPR